MLPHAELLSSDNMREVFDFFWNYRARWKFIGMELGIDVNTLEATDKDHRKAEDCLFELIGQWLRGGKATRNAMTRALQSKCVASGETSTQGIGYQVPSVQCILILHVSIQYHAHQCMVMLLTYRQV